MSQDERLRIWVDADACPRSIKEILYRAAERVRVTTTFVANATLSLPRSPWLRSLRVAHGFDVADHRILTDARPGDLVVTADIPLAAEAVQSGLHVLDPRGMRYTEENVQERLAVRDLMDGLRDAGMVTGGPASLGEADRRAFANELDRFLTRHAPPPDAG